MQMIYMDTGMHGRWLYCCFCSSVNTTSLDTVVAVFPAMYVATSMSYKAHILHASPTYLQILAQQAQPKSVAPNQGVNLLSVSSNSHYKGALLPQMVSGLKSLR